MTKPPTRIIKDCFGPMRRVEKFRLKHNHLPGDESVRHSKQAFADAYGPSQDYQAYLAAFDSGKLKEWLLGYKANPDDVKEHMKG